jgi:CubicO group peptidase (beta-lactamase class C family)
MRRLFLFLLFLSAVAIVSGQSKAATRDYFPSAQNWEKRSLQASGVDSIKLWNAIHFAIASENKKTRNMELAQSIDFGREPYSDGVGPFADRGDQTGIIIYHGYIIAEWGEPLRVDMTHSVTKSFLSSIVGLAIDQGLIKNVNDTVAKYIPPVELYDPASNINGSENSKVIYPFSSVHNQTLTWDVMLRQTSDWEGTLWGKPDWADRPPESYRTDPEKWINRERNEPGTVWKYNDVRVNALALAATCVWRKPLPQVLKQYIMDPIGASNTWRWYGYRNSWIVADGSPVQSVSGGGHWGGGMFINAYDMARFGLLTLHKGNWDGKQLISEKWIQQARTPTSAEPGYGYMNFFLNTDKKRLPDAPATAYMHVGNGSNIIYVDEEHDMVIVARWIENNAIDNFIKGILEAIK